MQCARDADAVDRFGRGCTCYRKRRRVQPKEMARVRRVARGPLRKSIEKQGLTAICKATFTMLLDVTLIRRLTLTPVKIRAMLFARLRAA